MEKIEIAKLQELKTHCERTDTCVGCAGIAGCDGDTVHSPLRLSFIIKTKKDKLDAKIETLKAIVVFLDRKNEEHRKKAYLTCEETCGCWTLEASINEIDQTIEEFSAESNEVAKKGESK